MSVLCASCNQLFGLDHVGSAPGSDAMHVQQAGECPVDFGSRRYLYVDILPTRWLEANAYCVSLDKVTDDAVYSHLAVIGSAAEAEVVKSLIPDDTFVGLSDAKQADTYLWVTTETTTIGAAWDTGEPDSSSSKPWGAALQPDGSLDAHGSGTSKPFLCECDEFPDAPAQYMP
jgi:hypothetical protein